MSNILKLKLGLIIFSLIVLGYNPLYNLLFYEEVTITRWQQLTWDDFQGFANPFHEFDASISSKVYVEYDTSAKKYFAYAGQNNKKSWKKARSVNYDDLLNHEQYHFNISEVHARMMNIYLEEYPTNTIEQHRKQLELIMHNLSEMQLEYDFETKHSLNFGMQKRWEYKIDSLLHRFSSKPFFTVDSITGGAVFFPYQPTFNIENEEDVAYRFYQLDNYEMSFTFISYEYGYFHKETFEESLDKIYDFDSLQILSVKIDSNRYERLIKFNELSKETISHHLWVYDKKHLYNLVVTYEGKDEYTEGFNKNAQSFINSFNIINNSD